MSGKMFSPRFDESVREEQAAQKRAADAPLLVPVMRGARPKGWPKHAGGIDGDGDDEVTYEDLGAALVRRHDCDAHVAAYSAPGLARRLGMNEDREGSGVTLWEALAAGALPGDVRMVAAVFDSDAPDHRATAEWRELSRARVRKLLDEKPGGLYYETRGGFRLMWSLATPLAIRTQDDAATWRASYLAACDDVDKYGVTCDRGCADWTRLFRLPRVVRDGAPTPEPVVLTSPVDGAWSLRVVERARVEPPPAVVRAGATTDELTLECRALMRAAADRMRSLDSLRALTGSRPRDHEQLLEVVLDGRPAKFDRTGNLVSFRIGTAIGDAAPEVGEDAAIAVARATLAAMAALGADSEHKLERGVRAGYDVAARWNAAPSAPTEPWPQLIARSLGDVQRTLSSDAPITELPEPLAEPVGALMLRQYAATPWLVENLVKRGGTLLVGGEPKTGKSWVLTEIAIAAATGTPAFGVFKVPEVVRGFYHYAEDLGEDVQAHVRALMAGRGATEEHWRLLRENLHVQPRGRFIDITSDADLALLVASCRRARAQFAFVEPLRDVHGGKENESDDMTKVMRRIRAWGEICGLTPGTAHHNKKGADDRGGANVRGSGAIWGALDSGLYLTNPSGDGACVLKMSVESEIKGARGGGRFDLELRIEDGPDGRATKATWTRSTTAPKGGRDAGTAPEAAPGDDVFRVVMRVKELLAAGQPQTLSQLRTNVPGVGEKRVVAAIAQATPSQLKRASWYDEHHREHRDRVLPVEYDPAKT